MRASRRLPVCLATALIRLYQLIISPFFKPCCRFWPSCSEYGLLAFRRHGFCRGFWLTCKRILRCHPFYRGHGYDPVPNKHRGNTDE